MSRAIKVLRRHEHKWDRIRTRTIMYNGGLNPMVPEGDIDDVLLLFRETNV